MLEALRKWWHDQRSGRRLWRPTLFFLGTLTVIKFAFPRLGLPPVPRYANVFVGTAALAALVGYALAKKQTSWYALVFHGVLCIGCWIAYVTMLDEFVGMTVFKTILLALTYCGTSFGLYGALRILYNVGVR